MLNESSSLLKEYLLISSKDYYDYLDSWQQFAFSTNEEKKQIKIDGIIL